MGDPGTPPGSLSCVGTLSGLAAFVSVRAFILPPWTLARIGACSLSLAMDGRAALAPRAGSSGLRGPFFFVGGNCLIHVRMGAVAANPLRALARAILTQVVIVPVAHKGRVRMRILRSAETCLCDGRHGGSARTAPRPISAIALNMCASEAAFGEIARNLAIGSRFTSLYSQGGGHPPSSRPS